MEHQAIRRTGSFPWQSMGNMTVEPLDILMATYNGERFVEQQIESILNQSYQNFHLYIRDDGSSDQTWPILKKIQSKFPEKITLIQDGTKKGVVGNFSSLMELSKAPYIMFSDQDDVWIPTKVEKTLGKMKETEASFGKEVPLLVHTDAFVARENLSLIAPSFWKYVSLHPFKRACFSALLVQNNVTGCCMMINRALLKQSIPIPAAAAMHDWWLALVAAAFGKVIPLKEPLIFYRQHSGNVLGAKKFFSFGNLKRLLKQYKGYRRFDSKAKNQAASFYQRYAPLLDRKNKEMISAYLQAYEQPFWQTKRQTLKYGLVKDGFFRALLWFLLKRYP